MSPRLRSMVRAFVASIKTTSAIAAASTLPILKNALTGWAVALGLACYLAGASFARPVVISAAPNPTKKPCNTCAAKRAAAARAAALRPEADPLFSTRDAGKEAKQ